MNSKQTTLQRFSTWLPHKGNVLFTLLVLGALLWVQTAEVISGTGITNSDTTISYQGYLADSNGDPLSGDYEMAFRLYPTQVDGTLLWEELWTAADVIPVTDGLFNVGLGEFNTALTDIIQANSDLYLGIAISTVGGGTLGTEDELSPRVQLTAAPFAIQQDLTIPDGSITIEKLAPDLLPVYPAESTTAYWTIPHCLDAGGDDSSYFEIPGMSVTFTLDRPSTVLVDTSGLVSNSEPGNKTYVVLFVNDTGLRYANGELKITGCQNSHGSISGQTMYCSFHDSQALDLPAGTHTIDSRAFCNGADGAGSVYGGTQRIVVSP